MARTKVMSHSVRALVEEKGLDGETPDQIMARECQAIVDSAAAFGWSGPPFCVEQLASIRGIGVDFVKPPFGEAQLIPLPNNRFRVVCDPNVATNRQRFSIAHELAHTVFPDCATQVQFRNGNGNDPEVEGLCHLGAAHLLMPPKAFLEVTPVPGHLTSSFDDVCDRFQVSQEAAIRHLIRLQNFDCIAIFLRPGRRKIEQKEFERTGRGPDPKMRVVRSQCSPSVEGFIPPNKSFPETSCVYRVERDRVAAIATEHVDLGRSFDTHWRVEAIPLRSTPGDSPTVLAVLSPA